MNAQLVKAAQTTFALLLYPILAGLMLLQGLALKSARWAIAYVLGAIAFLVSFAWFADRAEETTRMTDLPPALVGYLIGLTVTALIVLLGRAAR